MFVVSAVIDDTSFVVVLPFFYFGIINQTSNHFGNSIIEFLLKYGMIGQKPLT